MPYEIPIPKQTDSELLKALTETVSFTSDLVENISITPMLGAPLQLPAEKPEKTKEAATILKHKSQLIKTFSLVAKPQYRQQNRLLQLPSIRRQPDKPFDILSIPDQWNGGFGEEKDLEILDQLFLLQTKARQKLKASSLEASFRDSGQNEWEHFRSAQAIILESLAETSRNVISTTSEQIAAAENKQAERYDELSTKLRQEVENERSALEREKEFHLKELEEKETELRNREDSFNTKEARYVARQKQEEQVEEIKKGLNEWGLTEGTSKKRTPVFWAYMAALTVSGVVAGLTIFFNFRILEDVSVTASLAGWQWLLLILKTFLPLALFFTFLTYFIRWSNAWARLHADEEFRNRNLLVDIGRSGWLLEAVRDSQEPGKELPIELVRELSNNLFQRSQIIENDLDPHALSDVLMQGLSSLRIKSPDGSEVEATRGRRKT